MLKLSWYIILLLVITSFFTLSSYAQKQQIGFDVGIGNTIVEMEGIKFSLLKNPLKNNTSRYYTMGFSYYLRPNNAFFSFKSGVRFSDRKYNADQFNALKIPLGMNFIIGKQFSFIFGGGVYFNYLAHSTISFVNQKDFYVTKKTFQMGNEFNIGFLYELSEKMTISCSYQNNYDFKSLYTTTLIKRGRGIRSISEYPNYGYDSYLSIETRYTFK